MTYYDVFVSYSPPRAVRGGSRAHHRDEWVTGLKQQLERLIGSRNEAAGRASRPPSIYVYEAQPHGAKWKQNVASACRAQVLVAILSETYFESPTCFFEWYAFVTRSPDFGRNSGIEPHSLRNIVPVWRIEGPPPEKIQHLREPLRRQALATVVENVVTDWGFSRNEAERLVAQWVDSFFEIHAENLSPWASARIGEVYDSDVVSRLERIADSISLFLTLKPEPTPAERKLLVLSLFALGMDRYRNGGWGFSMGAEFERDEDGTLLPHGRDELNQLVVRALRGAIGGRLAFKEEEPALLSWNTTDHGPPSLASSPVKDRKQRAVSLSSLLNSYSIAPMRDVLVGASAHLKEEIKYQPFAQRWVLEQAPQPGSFHEVVFFDFAARVRAAFSDPDLLRWLPPQADVDRSFKSALSDLHAWVIKSDILGTLEKNVFEPLASLSSAEGATIPYKYDTLAIHLRMLASVDASAELLTGKKETDALDAITSHVEKITAKLKAAPNESMLRAFLRIFPLLLVSVQDLAHHIKRDFREQSATLQRQWLDLLDALGAARIASAMNAAGWAAVLIDAERRFEWEMSSALTPVWEFANDARDRRKKKMVEAMKRPEKESSKWLDELAGEEIEGLAVEAGMESGSLASDLVLLRSLFSFGALSRSVEHNLAKTKDQSVGLLLVDGTSNKVISATTGFNEIYIAPFSSRLGIGLATLERLIHELGTDDEDFIESLSKSVVLKCWPLDVVSPPIKHVPFITRSVDNARDMLAADQSKPHMTSRRDVLQLRLDHEKDSRFVLRTCSIVNQDDLLGLAPTVRLQGDFESRRIVLWTFVDISSWLPSDGFDLQSDLVLE